MNKILYLSFNNDRTCFTCGTTKGFSVYDSLTGDMRVSRLIGCTRIVEILNKSNILVFSGDKTNAKYNSNYIYVWDDNKQKVVMDTEYPSVVKAIKITSKHLYVVLDDQIHISNVDGFVHKKVIETAYNPNGIFAIDNNEHIIYPGDDIGYINVYSFEEDCVIKKIKAHDSAINQIYYSNNRIATASDKGTIIRIFDMDNGDKVKEYRRGVDMANIYNIDFNNRYMATTSSKGTIHVFDTKNTNNSSNLSYLSSVLPEYFGSEWSKLKVYTYKDCKHICCVSDYRIVVICYDGTMYTYTFDIDKCTTTEDHHKKFYLNMG